jgi:hypothetical protein
LLRDCTWAVGKASTTSYIWPAKQTKRPSLKRPQRKSYGLTPLLMKPFFAKIRVLLEAPAYIDDDLTSKPISGFYRIIGVVAKDLNEAKQCLQGTATEGAIDWVKTEFVEMSKVDPEIAKRYNLYKHDTSGVWYSSGRIFF